MTENDAPPPLEMLTSIPVPSTKSIKFHQFEIIRKGDKNPKLDLSEIPFYIEAYNLKTNFVYVCTAFDTTAVPMELRSYLLLFLDLILESPVKSEGEELLPYEAVVSALEEDMISYETSLGLQSASRFGCGPFSNTATFHMQSEVRKFEIASTWMTRLVFDSVFTQERVHIVASKLLNDIATSKRNGYDMAREITKAMFYKEDTNVQKNSVLTQHGFLTELLENLKTGSDEIIGNLNKLRDILVKSVTVHVAANFEKVKDLKTPLAAFSEKIKNLAAPVTKLPVTFDSSLINVNGNLEVRKI